MGSSIWGLIDDVLIPALEGTLKDRTVALLKEYADGLPADMEQFAVDLAGDAAQALAMGRLDLIEEIEAQVLLRAERQRIKLSQESQEFVLGVLHELLRFALQAGLVFTRGMAANLIAKIGEK